MTQARTMTQPKSPSTGIHHQIVLKYDLTKKTMQLSDNGVDCPNRTIRLHNDDQIEFSSPNGAVDILFDEPDLFSSPNYQGGPTPTGPVTVRNVHAGQKPTQFWCGIQGIVPASARIPQYGGTGEFPGT